MNLNDLTKEQKQYLVLGVLAAIILITLLVMGVRFSLSSIKEAKDQLAVLSEKIAMADRTLSSSEQVSADFRKTVKTLRERIMGVPPERNYYSWATEVIYSEARDANMEIDSIDEIGGLKGRSKRTQDEDIRLESYALMINAHGGYNDLKAFLLEMKEQYPLVRFTGLNISSGKNPETHKVQLWLQWPFGIAAIAENWDSLEAEQRSMNPGSAIDPADVESAANGEIQKEVSSFARESGTMPEDAAPVEPAGLRENMQQLESTVKAEPPPPAPRPKAIAEPQTDLAVSEPMPELQDDSMPMPQEEAVAISVMPVAESGEPVANEPEFIAAVPAIVTMAGPDGPDPAVTDSVESDSPVDSLSESGIESGAEPEAGPVPELLAEVVVEPVIEPVAEAVVEPDVASVDESVPMEQQPDTTADLQNTEQTEELQLEPDQTDEKPEDPLVMLSELMILTNRSEKESVESETATLEAVEPVAGEESNAASEPSDDIEFMLSELETGSESQPSEEPAKSTIQDINTADSVDAAEDTSTTMSGEEIVESGTDETAADESVIAEENNDGSDTPDDIEFMLSELETGPESQPSEEPSKSAIQETSATDDGYAAGDTDEAGEETSSYPAEPFSNETASDNAFAEKGEQKNESQQMEQNDEKSNDPLDSLLDSLIGG